MSGELLSNDEIMLSRRRDLLIFFAEDNDFPSEEYDTVECSSMNDGGMGSFKVTWIEQASDTAERAGVQYVYTDTDGVIVTISPFLNGKNRIVSVDFWKVDFSELKTFPQPGQLRRFVA